MFPNKAQRVGAFKGSLVRSRTLNAGCLVQLVAESRTVGSLRHWGLPVQLTKQAVTARRQPCGQLQKPDGTQAMAPVTPHPGSDLALQTAPDPDTG